MGVIYIGDRAVGKTHLALELANPRNRHVSVLQPSYENLKGLLLATKDSTKPTEIIDSRGLEIQAKLPSGGKNVYLDWIDTPGEIWRTRWQDSNPEEWQSFLSNAQESEGILLILEPYRDILPITMADSYSTQQQWCKRFDRWVDFFRYDCPKARLIVICLNKADLFISDLSQEASKLAFDPNGSAMNWQKRHNYVLQRYFRPVKKQIDEINQSTQGASVQCFITSIKSRPLLELPWVYLASFLAKY